VRETLGVDVVTRRGALFTARLSFFYGMGRTAQQLVGRVQRAYPAATIVESGEVWKPFRGGAPIAKQSHWYVTFTLGDMTEVARG
jgi:hypothetical protein